MKLSSCPLAKEDKSPFFSTSSLCVVFLGQGVKGSMDSDVEDAGFESDFEGMRSAEKLSIAALGAVAAQRRGAFFLELKKARSGLG